MEGIRRTQIYLDEDLDNQIRAVAVAEGRSAGAVIRDAARRYVSERSGLDNDPILLAAGTVAGLPPDAAAEHDRDLYTERLGR